MREFFWRLPRPLDIIRAACLCGAACSLAFCHPAAARTYEGVLQDPVVLGAWLYTGNCLTCHDGYGQDRLAEGYDDRSELIAAIGSGGCRVTWAGNAGGKLGANELAALAAYMLQWEEEDKEPSLPEQPPQPVEPVPELPAKTAGTPDSIPSPADKDDQLAPALARLTAANPVAEGGWLYTRNCYRCHLTYRQARMGKGMDREILRRTISEGKTSTQMKGFSRLLGGELKAGEIRAVVSYITTWEKKGEPLAIATGLMTQPAVDPADFVPVRLPRFQKISGDPALGYMVFLRNCITCHGTLGEGYIGRSLRYNKGVSRPDLFLKSMIKQGIPVTLMRSWANGPGKVLSAKDIDDVVSVLLTWSEDGPPAEKP